MLKITKVKFVGLLCAGFMFSDAAVFAEQKSIANADSLVPAVTQGDNAFYTESQIDAVWQAVTRSYKQPLPSGVAFPTSAPTFFHPNDGKRHFFQTGLLELIVARYWRCAWLDTSIVAARTNRVADQASANTKLEMYASLPEVSKHVNTAEYEQEMLTYARTTGLDSATAEYQIECAMYDKGAATR